MNFYRKNGSHHSEVNAGALTDIMFFLMLFFLIAATMTNPNVIKLMLPQSSTSQSLSKQTVNLSISADSTYYIDEREVSREDLEPELLKTLEKMKDATVVLRVEQDLPVKNLVEMLDIGNRNKLKMILATRK